MDLVQAGDDSIIENRLGHLVLQSGGDSDALVAAEVERI
jgi:hypothetical protein